MAASIYRWPHLFIDAAASIYRWPHLFIDAAASIYRWPHLFTDAAMYKNRFPKIEFAIERSNREILGRLVARYWAFFVFD